MRVFDGAGDSAARIRPPARVGIVLVMTLLAACSKSEPPPVLIAPESPPPVLAAECMAPDPAWVDVPDADVTRSVAARNVRANKGRYREIMARREICRVSIAAHGLAGPVPPARVASR